MSNLNIYETITTKDYDFYSHVKEIPKTRYLISLKHSIEHCANIELFDLPKKGKARTIYTFEEVDGGNNFKSEVDLLLFKEKAKLCCLYYSLSLFILCKAYALLDSNWGRRCDL